LNIANPALAPALNRNPSPLTAPGPDPSPPRKALLRQPTWTSSGSAGSLRRHLAKAQSAALSQDTAPPGGTVPLPVRADPPPLFEVGLVTSRHPDPIEPLRRRRGRGRVLHRVCHVRAHRDLGPLRQVRGGLEGVEKILFNTAADRPRNRNARRWKPRTLTARTPALHRTGCAPAPRSTAFWSAIPWPVLARAFEPLDPELPTLI